LALKDVKEPEVELEDSVLLFFGRIGRLIYAFWLKVGEHMVKLSR